MLEVGGIDGAVDRGAVVERGQVRHGTFAHFGGTRKINQGPDDNGHGHNDRPGTQEKLARPLPHAPENIAHPRQAVGRHLEKKWLGSGVQDKFIDRPSHGHGDREADDMHGEKHPARQGGSEGRLDECADHQRVDRQPRRATHERGNQNGGQSRPRILDGPRGEDTRNGAGIAGEHGHETFPVESAPAEHFIHEEGAARHVAGVFEQGDEEKENENLGQENNHPTDPADDPGDDQTLQGGPRSKPRRDQFLGLRDDHLDRLHEGSGPRVNRLKNDEHHQHKDGQPPDAMGQHGIETFGRGTPPLFRELDRVGREVAEVLVAQERFGGKRVPSRGGQNIT